MRAAPRNADKLCAMRKNGSVTKSFASKEALVKWVALEYGRSWADELMVNEQGPSTSQGVTQLPPHPPPPPLVPPTPTPSSSKGKTLVRLPNQPAKTRSTVVSTTLPAGTGSAPTPPPPQS